MEVKYFVHNHVTSKHQNGIQTPLYQSPKLVLFPLYCCPCFGNNQPEGVRDIDVSSYVTA